MLVNAVRSVRSRRSVCDRIARRIGRAVAACFAVLVFPAALLAAGGGDAPTKRPLAEPFGQNVQLRDGLANARLRFERDKKGTVAFIGGSITEMNGYRPMVCANLKARFPQTDFTFIDAGISSTCSTTGAFRLERDVLSKGPIDLFFVEFAVNDDQDAHHTREECIAGMEGIIRHARKSNAAMDMVVTYFVNEGMLKTLADGKTPLPVAAHEAVAEHYGVPSINLAKEVSQEMAAGTLTWETYGGVHPAPRGNRLCANMIEELFARAWKAPTAVEKEKPHEMPKALDAMNYERGRFIDPKAAKVEGGWSIGVPNWKSLPGATRDQFTAIPMFCATEAGAKATLEFEGTAIGAFVVAGPDAGVLEASIDGGPAHAVDLYHDFSKGLHYPRTVMLGTDLKPGRHVLTIVVAKETHSKGHAARVMAFAAN